MVELILVVLGAVLGVGGTLLAFHVRRQYRRSDFNKSVCVDFRELRYKMACDGFLLRSKACSLTREFLDWCNPIYDERQGKPNAGPDEARKAFDKLNDEELRILCEADRKRQLEMDAGKERSELPKKAELPTLEANIGSLSLFPGDYQKVVLDIRSGVSRFNQDVDDLERNHGRTFDTVLSAENQRVVQQNLKESYKRMGESTFRLGKRIDGFLATYEKEF